MISVAELVTDPDFAQSATIERSSFFPGMVADQSIPTDIAFVGVIQPARSQDLVQLPEGDRIKAALTVYSPQPIFLTREGSGEGLSDVLLYEGDRYRFMQVTGWQDNGYYLGIAVKMGG